MTSHQIVIVRADLPDYHWFIYGTPFKALCRELGGAEMLGLQQDFLEAPGPGVRWRTMCIHTCRKA